MGYTLAFHTNLHLSGLWFGSLTGAFIVGRAAQLTLCTTQKVSLLCGTLTRLLVGTDDCAAVTKLGRTFCDMSCSVV